MLQSLHVKNSIWQATAVSSSSVTARDFVSHPYLAFWKPCSSVGVALALFEFSAWGMLVLLQWYLPTSGLGEINKDGPCQMLAPPLVFTEGWSVVIVRQSNICNLPANHTLLRFKKQKQTKPTKQQQQKTASLYYMLKTRMWCLVCIRKIFGNLYLGSTL